jgi:hypothetical protein
MRGLSRAILAAGFVFAHVASAQVTPTSTTTNAHNVDCRGLKLVSASGIPAGPTREYKLHGLCNIQEVYSKTGSFAGFEYDQDDPEAKTLATVWTDVVATWNSQTGDFTEAAKTQAPYAGLVSMVLRCAGDPVLTGVTCKGLGYSNTTGWDGFDRAYAIPRPISRGKTSLAEATALSQQPVASTPPPPPPPPAPTPTSPTIQRVPVPTRTAPVAVAPPRIALAPVRSTPSPAPPPPESAGPVEVALAPAVRLDLQDGRAIVADNGEGALRWAIAGPTGQLLRRFPAGSKVTEGSSHDLTVHYPGGSYRAGQLKPEKSRRQGHLPEKSKGQGHRH